MNKLLVNFFGGPGIGKTTAAADLFVRLKQQGIEVEFISEFPKDMVLEGRSEVLKEHQWYVTANQAYRIHCAYKHMQVVVTDSPILLGPIYDADASLSLRELSLEYHKRYKNLNIVLERNPNNIHTMAGRVHSLVESVSIDKQIVEFLTQNDIEYLVLDNRLSMKEIEEFVLFSLSYYKDIYEQED